MSPLTSLLLTLLSAAPGVAGRAGPVTARAGDPPSDPATVASAASPAAGAKPTPATPAGAAVAPEVVTVVAVGDAPVGPAPEVAELAHQLRGACRDRVAGVQEVPEMRARLLGDTARATLAELERAYVGAQAAFQADELDSARRTLRAIGDDLEQLPETTEAFGLWARTQLRVALVERISLRPAAMAAALDRVLAVDPGVLVDPQQYAPSFRREVEEARRRIAQGPRARLTLTSNGAPATAYVNGKEVGRTPVTLALPPGRYRIGGAAGRLRAPRTWIDVATEDRRVELDLALAEAVHPEAGPGLAVSPAHRASELVRAGSWLGADRLVAAAVVAEGEARFLSGAVYDVRRGALLREGRVRMAAGAVSSAHLGALAAFLLTGQPAQGVVAVAPLAARAPEGSGVDLRSPAASVAARAPVRGGWLRPTAYASGSLALGLAGVATWQALAARDGYRDAAGLVRADGALVAGADRAGYDRAVSGADAAKRNAWLAGAGAAAFAVAAGVLGYLSADAGGAPVVRF